MIYIYNHIFACPVVVKSLNCITLHISVVLVHVFRDVKVNIINKYRSDTFLNSLDVPILHGLLDYKLNFKLMVCCTRKERKKKKKKKKLYLSLSAQFSLNDQHLEQISKFIWIHMFRKIS